MTFNVMILVIVYAYTRTHNHSVVCFDKITPLLLIEIRLNFQFVVALSSYWRFFLILSLSFSFLGERNEGRTRFSRITAASFSIHFIRSIFASRWSMFRFLTISFWMSVLLTCLRIPNGLLRWIDVVQFDIHF